MAFFKKIMDHLLNQVIVDTLAHSRWFQRFVVHTHKLQKEVATKGAEHGKVLDEHINKFTEIAKETAANLRKEFQQELQKVQQAEAAKQQATKR